MGFLWVANMQLKSCHWKESSVVYDLVTDCFEERSVWLGYKNYQLKKFTQLT